jgi:NAD(P)H dehydrogenase (quinone)
MKVLVVLAHPEPLSFNGAMFRTAVEKLMMEGHEVETSDLYQMDFDAVSGRHNFTTVKDPNYFKQQMEEMYATESDGFADDIETEIEKIEWCDLMIWQFPLWWFGLPAILKGWVDRVFAMGRTYGGDKLYANGVKAKGGCFH